MESISTYSEARSEYLKQLSTWVVPYMIQHYRNVWSEAQKIGGSKREMLVFQEKCAEVPKWNQDIIDTNVGDLLENCRCDYLEELMAAVFIAHTKVITAIRVSTKPKKLQITLPKLDHFLHRIFSECARSFWKTPFLFLDDQKPIEMQKNLLQAEALCSESIATAVRSLLPIKNILKEYLSDDVMSAEPIVEEAATSPEVPEVKEEPLAKEEPLVKDEPLVKEEPLAMEEPLAKEEPLAMEEPLVKEETTIKELIVDTPIKALELAPAEALELAPAEALALESASVVSTEVGPSDEEIVIETEPSVHFSDYDNVFAEKVGTFEYNPKDFDDTPSLRIMEDTSSDLVLDDSITNLESSGLTADEILE